MAESIALVLVEQEPRVQVSLLKIICITCQRGVILELDPSVKKAMTVLQGKTNLSYLLAKIRGAILNLNIQSNHIVQIEICEDFEFSKLEGQLNEYSRNESKS